MKKETLQVNGHIANDKDGTIFCKGGKYFVFSREIWDLFIKELLKTKRIETDKYIFTY